jgi:transcriptional antiterminator RfaH
LAGYRIYNPRLRVVRRNFGRKLETQTPLFPGYLFVWIELQWSTARWAPGVRGLVMDGTQPAAVNDRIIAEIRARERNGVVVLPKRELRRGDAVRVISGPLRELTGLVANMKPQERVELLLAALGRVTLRRDDVEAVG